VHVDASWRPEYEDRWYFNQTGKTSNPVLVRLTT